MNHKEEKASMGRRDFLKVATASTVVGAAVVATSGEAQATDVSVNADQSGGYSETSHIAKYYELANF